MVPIGLPDQIRFEVNLNSQLSEYDHPIQIN